MFNGWHQRKLGPLLARRLTSPRSASARRAQVRLVARCSVRGVRHLAGNFDLCSSSEALPFAAFEAPLAEAPRLARDRSIRLLELDEPVRYRLAPLEQSDLPCPELTELYKGENSPLREYTGQDVRVHVLDTGLAEHPHLPPIESVVCTGESSPEDLCGHSTGIAGIYVGRGPHPGLVPSAKLTAAKIFDDQERTAPSWILTACAHAIEYSAQVVSMSWGSLSPSPVLADAMRALYQHGICLVAAAGNEGHRGTDWPGNDPHVLSVAALDGRGRLADFSGRGDPKRPETWPNLAAEGVAVTMPRSPQSVYAPPPLPEDPLYCRADGTSFAAPIVGALAAMVIEALGDVGPARVYRCLRRCGRR